MKLSVWGDHRYPGLSHRSARRSRPLIQGLALAIVAASMAVPARVAAVSPGTLSGTVTDTTGHPISGLEIVLGSFPADANPNVAAYTNAEGAYTISAAAGDYDIFLYDATGTYIYGCFDSYRAGSFVALSGPVMCMAKTLTDGQADHVNFAVPRARHLSGKISTSDGSRPARIFIDALDADGNNQGEIQAVAADGSFTFTLPPGEYQFAVSGTMFYSDGCFKAGAPGGLSTNDTDCTLLDATTSDVSGINMTLQRNAVVGHLIEGTVTGPGDIALPGIRVELTPTDMLGFSAFTDSSGHYSALVTPGDYQIAVSDPAKTYASGCYDGAEPGQFVFNCQSFETVYIDSSDVSGIDMSLPIGGQTATGTDVWVDPSQSSGSGINASVNFSVVGTAGTTTLSVSASGPAPEGFSLGQNGVFYDLSSTATYEDAITICFGFNPAAYSDLSALRLYHYDHGSWQDVTTKVDYQTFQICGTASSLSPFAIGELQQSQTISFAPIPDQILGAAAVQLSATASSGLAVEFSAAGPCTISAGLVVLAGVGSCSVTATQPGNGAWAAATPVTQSFAIRASASEEAPGTYHAITPTRVLDTRNGTGLSGPFTNHAARMFTVGGIPAGATAVTGNLTVTGQTSSGYLYIGPVATNNPTSSTLNFPAGDDRANAVTVALGAGGTLSITFVAPSSGPTAHAIFDVTGYFMPDTSGATYHAGSPTRALDTRDGTGGLSGPFTNHAARTFTVSGVPGGAIAVTGNLTVTGQTSSGYLFIGPAATDNPTSSTLNFPAGDDRANAVTVALGAGGTLSITFVAPSNGPTAHAIFDITGYFTQDMTGAVYVPLRPTRALDTRDGTGGLAGPFTNHAARTFTVSGIPAGATAVTGNLTVTGQTSGGYLFMGPAATVNPTTSTLNFPAADDRANAVTIALSNTGTLSITFVAPSNGPTAMAILDVTGYFTPAGG